MDTDAVPTKGLEPYHHFLVPRETFTLFEGVESAPVMEPTARPAGGGGDDNDDDDDDDEKKEEEEEKKELGVSAPSLAGAPDAVIKAVGQTRSWAERLVAALAAYKEGLAARKADEKAKEEKRAAAKPEAKRGVKRKAVEELTGPR